jgi:excisionase family DNA binding protein
MNQLPKKQWSNSISSIEEPFYPRAPVFEKLVWSVEDVARELSVSVRHVYKLMSSNKIPYSKVGRSVRFSPVKIAEWLQKGGTR